MSVGSSWNRFMFARNDYECHPLRVFFSVFSTFFLGLVIVVFSSRTCRREARSMRGLATALVPCFGQALIPDM